MKKNFTNLIKRNFYTKIRGFPDRKAIQVTSFVKTGSKEKKLLIKQLRINKFCKNACLKRFFRAFPSGFESVSFVVLSQNILPSRKSRLCSLRHCRHRSALEACCFFLRKIHSSFYGMRRRISKRCLRSRSVFSGARSPSVSSQDAEPAS